MANEVVTTEFANKLNAALRYGGSNAAMLFTVMGVFSLLTPDQIVSLKTQIDVLQQSVMTAYGALTKMWIILGPIAAIWLAKVGMNSSTVQAMAGKLLGIAKNDPAKSQEAKEALITAAASPDIGTKAIINPTLAASPATPGNVVVSAAAAAAHTVPPAPAV